MDTATHRLGFQVSSITTGRVLYTVGFGSQFRRDIDGSHTPSHGISLTPDERQLWVMDWPHHYVHVFDVSAVPHRRPREIANIKLVHDNSDGWIQMRRNGCFAYVGDSGDPTHHPLDVTDPLLAWSRFRLDLKPMSRGVDVASPTSTRQSCTTLPGPPQLPMTIRAERGRLRGELQQSASVQTNLNGIRLMVIGPAPLGSEGAAYLATPDSQVDPVDGGRAG